MSDLLNVIGVNGVNGVNAGVISLEGSILIPQLLLSDKLIIVPANSPLITVQELGRVAPFLKSIIVVESNPAIPFWAWIVASVNVALTFENSAAVEVPAAKSNVFDTSYV